MTQRTTPIVIVLWLAKLVAAGALGFAAYHKFTGNPGDVKLFTMLGMEPIGRYLIAALESIAAILILVPMSAIYGALLGLGIMTGAIIGHLTTIGLDGLQYAAVVFAGCSAILYIRRHDASFLRNLWDR